MKVASLTSNPVSAAPAAKVYQYLKLTKSNIADTDASKIAVSFKVPKSWLADNKVADADVALYRYSDDKWNVLTTAKTGEDANNVLYQSTTPGFSTFAIGIKEAVPAAAPPTGEQPAVPAPEQGQPGAAATGAAAPEKAMEKKPLSTTTMAWIVVAIIVVIAGIGYFMWQKKKTG